MPAPTPIAVVYKYSEAARRRRLSDTLLTEGPVTVDWRYYSLFDPRQIRFISLHTGPVTTWEWDFGDGTNNSFVRDPFHQFEVVGSSTEYDVRLTVNGSVFKERTITIFAPQAGAGGALDAYTLTVEEALNMTVDQANRMTAV